MFDFTNEKMEEKIAERDADRKAKMLFSKMLSEAILSSEKTPENVKLTVRVMDKTTDIQEALRESVGKYITPGKEADIETLKKVLEYLELVEVGIKRFFETTPFVENTEEDEE